VVRLAPHRIGFLPRLFGMAQTVSALSLGAASVSHLDIATPSSAGAVYALGNVAAAAPGSFMVSWFGRSLEEGVMDQILEKAGEAALTCLQ